MMRHLAPSPWALAFGFGRMADACRRMGAPDLAASFDADAGREARRALRGAA